MLPFSVLHFFTYICYISILLKTYIHLTYENKVASADKMSPVTQKVFAQGADFVAKQSLCDKGESLQHLAVTGFHGGG